ncbi:hypothetical protein TGAM01_v204738 [Trichoderma gamsii]|uniref:SnoaL-like domain-containing protein n=1 Tax=Trichoderma gamsii TaxID=398673 RepID=A0A2P4ZPQ9_9HYPO|nr:hypothetical protein TGAM01_v204738 [Trichoderma gamsii]PON26262.1 hypothetical protein TGAM01_v204738 [Trichoderma gamsii]
MEPITLFNHFDELFKVLFFQNDNEAGSKAFVDNFAKDFTASINSQHLDYNAFQKACAIAREDWTMSLQSHEALVTSFDAQGENYPHDKGPNAVATKSFWTFEEKATGKKTRRETVIIIITRLEEDRVRRVTQWTEVTRDLE